MTTSSTRSTARFALVPLAALVAHATSLVAGFVWLDHAHIEGGLGLAPSGDWLRLFTTGFAGTGFYRPLMSVSLSLDAALGGMPWLYHATSLLWHAGAAALTVMAAETFGLPRRAALLAGLLFAVHPVTSLVASAIAFRSESMIAVAILGLIVAHRRGRPWIAALALLGGALTKETALVLGPLVIAAVEIDRRWATEPHPGSETGRASRTRLFALEASAFAVALGMRLAFAPAWRAAFAPLTATESVGTRLGGLGKSVLALVFPVDRTICDVFPVLGLSDWRVWLGAAALAAIGVVAWRRRGPALLLALSLVPSLHLVPIMRWWSPHYLYVPLAFAVMLVAELLVARVRPPLQGWVTGVVAIGLAVVTLRDDLRFRDDATLWTAEVAAKPTCREGQFYLGEVALESGQWEAAAEHFEQASAATPRALSYVDQEAVLQNLGAARLEQRRLPEAGSAFRAALALTHDEQARRHLVHDLAATELHAGNAAEAARLLEPEVTRSDALDESILVRARALHELGREDEAGALVRRLHLKPGLRAH